MSSTSRRNFIRGAAPLLLVASPCSRAALAETLTEGNAEAALSPVEDLMREHGIIRRSLLIYEQLAQQIDLGLDVNLKALAQTADLVRQFGERYHEHIEEFGVFPLMRKASKLLPLVDTLVAQHQRGREITIYFIALAKSGSPGKGEKKELAEQLRNFSRMYAHHAVREDTILFPALYQIVDTAGLKELGGRFEDAEQTILGRKGFENAVARVAEIEATLRMVNLSNFTAPPAPKL